MANERDNDTFKKQILASWHDLGVDVTREDSVTPFKAQKEKKKKYVKREMMDTKNASGG